jgi:hypothetical protein
MFARPVWDRENARSRNVTQVLDDARSLPGTEEQGNLAMRASLHKINYMEWYIAMFRGLCLTAWKTSCRLESGQHIGECFELDQNLQEYITKLPRLLLSLVLAGVLLGGCEVN